jgi:SP family general alpha glucoside:H+ symporter-like MFS transporter
MESTDKQVGLTTAQLDLIGHQSSVDPALLADGLEQVEREKKATFREAIRHHWRAVLWSALLSMALVMDSFDGSLVSSTTR